MKALIYKDFKLAIPKLCYLFLLMAAMLIIPSYPYWVGMMYFFFLVQIPYSLSRANRDMEFNATLPVSRGEIVNAKIIVMMIIQVLQLIVAVPFALLSILVLNKDGNLAGMDANFAFFGMVFVCYGVFDLAFFNSFFKSGYKLGTPLLSGLIAFAVTCVAFELLVNLIPALKISLDGTDPQYLWARLLTLFVGMAIFVSLNILTSKISQKRFLKVNL